MIHIVYTDAHEAVRQIAGFLAERFRADGVETRMGHFDEIDLIPPGGVLVLGFPSGVVGWQADARRFLERNEQVILDAPPWLFTVSEDPAATERAGTAPLTVAEHLALGEDGVEADAARERAAGFADRLLAARPRHRHAAGVVPAAPAGVQIERAGHAGHAGAGEHRPPTLVLRAEAEAEAEAERESAARRGRRSRAWLLGGGLVALVAVIAVIALFTTGVLGTGRGPLTTVTGVIGSEKLAFFEDQRVRDALAAHGLRVEPRAAGSLKMAEMADLAQYDFAFPASATAAEHIEHEVDGIIGTHQPFFSPMAIATHEPVLALLEAAGVAGRGPDGTRTINLEAYLGLVERGTRWQDLPGAQESYPSPRNVLISSSDVRSSNAAVMYLELAAYVANGYGVPVETAQADRIMPQLEHLFLGQGYIGQSSTAPFRDYLDLGIGAVPMVMIYESQFLAEQAREGSRIREGMALAYPAPTIFSAHTGVTFTQGGETLMHALQEDDRLAELLAEHGFRVSGQHAGTFERHLQEKGIAGYPPSGSFVNVAEEPSHEMLDYMLERMRAAYEVSGAPPATPEETDDHDHDHGHPEPEPTATS